MGKLLIHKIGPGELILTCILSLYLNFKIFSAIVALTFIISSFTGLYLYLQNYNQYWKKKGVPGPDGNFLFGNMFEALKGLNNFDKENEKKYGKYFGIMMNGTPEFCTTDLDFLKQVLIKNFDSFPDRHDTLNRTTDPLKKNFLTIVQGDDWRRIRHRITPAFTTGKMKKLLPAINYCTKELVEHLNEYAKTQKDVPLKETLAKLTMDAIGRAAFAIELNSFDENEPSKFLYYAKKLLDFRFKDPAILFMILFPNFSLLYSKITKKSVHQNDVFEYFNATLTDLMNQRLNDPLASTKYNDAFQLLLNAINDDEKPQYTSEDADIISDTVSKGDKTKTLTKYEILAQLVIFLAAGYETTATTLHFICYNLAYHQDVQDKLRDEVMTVLNGKDTIDYDDMSKLQYLNQVIMETLRMFPPVIKMNRLCQKDVVIDGIEFEKGTAISFDIYNIHHDPEIYPDPYKFDPGRFSPENRESRHPLAFMPFGAGPRICLGMRFAEFEMRVALVDLIKNFRFLPSHGMPGVPVSIDSRVLIKPIVDLKCRVERI